MPDAPADRPFELNGVNHLALVCRDMARTVDFYTNVLGHAADQDHRAARRAWASTSSSTAAAATAWPSSGSPTRPSRRPGVSAPAARPDQGDLTSAIGSMNHVAFDVPPDKIERVPGASARRRRRLHRGGQPRRQRVGHQPTSCTRASSCARSTSRIPTGSCSSSPAGPRRSVPTTSPSCRPAAVVAGRRPEPRPCPDSARSPRTRPRRPSSRSCTTSSSRAATRWPSRAPATGSPGDWWTVFALVPDVLDHAVAGLRPLRQPDAAARPGAARAGPDPGRVGRRQPVRLLPALQVPARAGRERGEDRGRARTGRPPTASTRSSGWCWPTPTAWCSTAGGCPTGCSTRCASHLSDEQILELTYITALYLQHAVMSRALRTEFDDRPEPVVEVAAPDGADVGLDITAPKT